MLEVDPTNVKYPSLVDRATQLEPLITHEGANYLLMWDYICLLKENLHLEKFQERGTQNVANIYHRSTIITCKEKFRILRLTCFHQKYHLQIFSI